mgnify:CR=1 FL=1
MSYNVTEQRRATMIKRLGEAVELIDDKRFLPFYRSIQIKLDKLGKSEEWGKIIETARTKAEPSRYFAKVCKMIKDGTYRFVEKVKEIASATALHLGDKLVKWGFGKYQRFYVRKADEFIKANGMAGFVELLEYAERKGVSQKYLAKALINCKSPRVYYQQNVIGGAK